jgi:hypothetical protein
MDQALVNKSNMLTRYRFAAGMSRVVVAALTTVVVMASAGTVAAAGRLQVNALVRCTATFDQQVVEAERLRAKAAAAGSEWLDTEELLNRAKDEAANENMEAACSLLELAVFQANTAIRQAEHEADAWRKRVVR